MEMLSVEHFVIIPIQGDRRRRQRILCNLLLSIAASLATYPYFASPPAAAATTRSGHRVTLLNLEGFVEGSTQRPPHTLNILHVDAGILNTNRPFFDSFVAISVTELR